MPDDDQDAAAQPGRSQADKERSRQQSRSVSPREASRTSGTKRSGGTSGGSRSGSSGRGGGNGAGRSGQKAGKSNQQSQQGQQRNGGGARTATPSGGNAQRRAAQRSATTATAVKSRTPRGPGGRASASSTGRSRRGLYTWGAVALVVVIVAVVVAVSQLGGSSPSTSSSEATPAPASVTNAVTSVPASVFDKVGISAPAEAEFNPPSVVTGQPLLTFTENGKTLPGVFYYGAEFCPYCAAERWAFAVTLARFGTLSDLDVVRSNSTDIYPNTATLSFVRANYSSPYIALRTIEAENVNHDTLQTPNKEEAALVSKYDTSKYVDGLSSDDDGSIPFIDFGNKAVIGGASYLPAVLAGLDQEQIAKNLSDPSNPVTKAIITTSNYQSAAICSMTKGQPSSVCDSSGVQAAAKALKISF